MGFLTDDEGNTSYKKLFIFSFVLSLITQWWTGRNAEQNAAYNENKARSLKSKMFEKRMTADQENAWARDILKRKGVYCHHCDHYVWSIPCCYICGNFVVSTRYWTEGGGLYPEHLPGDWDTNDKTWTMNALSSSREVRRKAGFKTDEDFRFRYPDLKCEMTDEEYSSEKFKSSDTTFTSNSKNSTVLDGTSVVKFTKNRR